jgi:hypothetical protein
VSIVVDLGVFEEDTELSVEASFDIFAVFEEFTGLFCEFSFLFLAENMLL